MSERLHEPDAGAPPRALRQGLGFAVSGCLAFCVDALVLAVLTHAFGAPPLAARAVAISLAMVAGWLSHRRLTFAVVSRPGFAEFVRYATLAWVAAAINYAGFAAILLARPATEPLVALVVSSLIAMIFAYLGMRFGVFRGNLR